MPGRIIRTRTAGKVADFLATREGKNHLSAYGWFPGMPIVVTQAEESLLDAMAMVSVHGQAVFIAMLDPHTQDLRMMHISTPQAALRVVTPTPDRLTVKEFFDHVDENKLAEFRVKHWKHTAIASILPSCAAMKDRGYRSHGYLPIETVTV